MKSWFATDRRDTVPVCDKTVTYTVTDETKVKRGEKDGKLENILKYFGEQAKEGDKFEITVDKDKKNVIEIKLKGKKE